VKVTFVTAAANSGAVLTLTKSGTFFKSTATAFHTANYIYAKIADANGGQVTLANNAGAPVIVSDLVDVDGLPVAAETITNADGGTTGDYGKAVDAGVANATRIANDGIYGITWTPSTTYPATAAAAVRVRYGAASATTAVTVYPAASTGGAAGTPVITAAGLSAASVAPNWTVPLTTTSITVTIPGGTSGNTYTYKATYTGTYVAGDVSPLNAIQKTAVANASGVVSFTVTNATPADAAKVTVNVAGFASGWTDQVITWSKSKAAAMSVTLGGAYVALKSANTFTATVTDAFGAPVAGVVLKPVVSGSNADLSTAPRASVTTAADGTASITLTDAAAVAAGTDKVTFTTADGALSKASTITYAATAPVATALAATYNADPTKTGADISSLVPSTGIYASGTDKFPVQIARNNTSAMTAAASKDQLVFRISAGVAGVAVTATASTGAYVFGSADTQKSSRTSYTDADGFVEFIAGSNVAGANTITFTSGTVTTSAAFWTSTAKANGRFVTLTQKDGVVTAKLTDRYGNGIAGATIQMSTSNGTLGNGQLTTVYTTDTTGSISVLPVGTSSATVTATLTDTAVTDVASIAGYVSTTPVEATLAAGNKVATLAVADSAAADAAAQAATDAAAEATDAANAATDAANAAAEAADAATAAAQDAADAVAALSTQVSEMVNALKKQITALTNLVIKIQKKVKA
jgi:trimeric autotransporter adhesin